MTVLKIDRDYTVRTLADLVRINSINPSIAPDGPGEAEIAAYVAAALGALGLETAVHEPERRRPTAVGTLRGAGGGRSLMLNAHADTVGVEGMPEPFSAFIRDGKLYGRGAHDMKGSLASSIGAAKALVDAGVRLRGDLVIAAVADEEYGSLGTADLIERYRVDAAIVTEPTNLDICLAHKGYVWIEVETIGKAAHGSRFTEGVDANMRMGRFLAELDKLERSLRAGPAHPLVGPPSLHAAIVSGGSGLSTYAAACTLKIERRTIPGETEADSVGEIQAIVDRLAAADPTFRAKVKPFFARHPFEVSPGAEIVKVLGRAARETLGHQPAFVGDTPWMDSALLADAGIETVVMGPCGAGEHSIEEWVDLESVIAMAEILARTAIAYCEVLT
jgi:acetylornithine deacetylase